ncbi:hypothetical protein [Streptosporangium carneum]|uniref:Peptidase MA-like domain-containing protein n=1 Tax=Streptosporangium carneum TaxID=47481 RepID=A0A9W6HZ76_9ACTN|nr:hypothetical protein [Streptosporangium carneum]GLK08089.1 hypothetical protein GCM10017600_14940 [Streptosporangium carneum]
MSRQRWWKARPWAWTLVGLALVLGTGTGVVAVAFPAVAATACPACYGLESLGPRLYVEQGLPAERRRQVAEVVRAAERRVSDFYGGRRSSPLVLACLTEECYRRIGGGGERGVAVLNRAVMLSSRGVDPVIASHELSHVEFHDRLGGERGVPQWFDEGLAVLVSEDPRYLAPETAGDRCRAGSQEALPVTLEEWLRAASADQQVYARAACRVSTWADAHGGRSALLGLVERVAAGERFALS